MIKAKAGCKGCYYEDKDTCPAQLDHKPWLDPNRPCQSDDAELIYTEEDICTE